MADLRAYRAKRDFTKTSEPRGQVPARQSKSGRFVIQRHEATRLHFDLRLELNGVYKSWAVTKVPSLDPATKRLAVEVEDHPIEYGTFEGTIPEGEYGGGTVQLWDRGTWQPKGDHPAADLAKGALKFEMGGERMKGGWALIRMRSDPGRGGRSTRNNWLLVKERDEWAQPGEPDALADAVTSVKTGRTLEEIANSKRKNVWHSSREGSDTTPEKKPAAKKPAAKKPAASKADTVVAGVMITHPEK